MVTVELLVSGDQKPMVFSLVDQVSRTQSIGSLLIGQNPFMMMGLLICFQSIVLIIFNSIIFVKLNYLNIAIHNRYCPFLIAPYAELERDSGSVSTQINTIELLPLLKKLWAVKKSIQIIVHRTKILMFNHL